MLETRQRSAPFSNESEVGIGPPGPPLWGAHWDHGIHLDDEVVTATADSTVERMIEFAANIVEMLGSTAGVLLRLEDLESRLNTLTRSFQSFAEQAQLPAKKCVVVPIQHLPNGYHLRRPIQVFVEPEDEGFVASFVDANVNISGDTLHEAVENLKLLILDLYVELREVPASSLGPGPARQLEVLSFFIREE